MLFGTGFKTFLADLLITGETLEPVFIHNPKSQTIATILTTDVNALIAQLLGTKSTVTTQTVAQVQNPSIT